MSCPLLPTSPRLPLSVVVPLGDILTPPVLRLTSPLKPTIIHTTLQRSQWLYHWETFRHLLFFTSPLPRNLPSFTPLSNTLSGCTTGRHSDTSCSSPHLFSPKTYGCSHHSNGLQCSLQLEDILTPLLCLFFISPSSPTQWFCHPAIFIIASSNVSILTYYIYRSDKGYAGSKYLLVPGVGVFFSQCYHLTCHSWPSKSHNNQSGMGPEGASQSCANSMMVDECLSPFGICAHNSPLCWTIVLASHLQSTDCSFGTRPWPLETGQVHCRIMAGFGAMSLLCHRHAPL